MWSKSILITGRWYCHIAWDPTNQESVVYEWKHFHECTSFIGQLWAESAGQGFYEMRCDSYRREPSSKPLLMTTTPCLYCREMIQCNLKRTSRYAWESKALYREMAIATSSDAVLYNAVSAMRTNTVRYLMLNCYHACRGEWLLLHMVR